MSGRGAGTLAVVTALGAMLAALALPAGHGAAGLLADPAAVPAAGPASTPAGGAPTVDVQLYSGFTPYGQRVLIGTVPAIADRLELTNAGATATVGLADQGTLEGLRRHIQVPLPGTGPWQATALWAEHRLGTDGGGPEGPSRNGTV